VHFDNPPKAAVSTRSSDLWVCNMSPLIDEIAGCCKTLDDSGRFLRLTRGLFLKACPRALCDVGNINGDVGNCEMSVIARGATCGASHLRKVAAFSARSSDMWVRYMSALSGNTAGFCKTLDDGGRFLRLKRGLFLKSCPRALCDI